MHSSAELPTGVSERPGRSPRRRARPEQGWSLLCNGVIAFDDGGDLLPDGFAVAAAHAA